MSLCRSKYVQSDMSGVLPEVKDLLDSGKQVIFSGTPCQIETLRSFLKRDYVNLITCELFCYGTPEKKVYDQYLNYLENRYASKIVSINFKDKRYGWDYYTTCVRFENRREHCVFGGDSYSRLMRLWYSLMPGCLQCKRSLRSSKADFVLGDFYAYAKYIKESPPKNGISCVVVNSEKGMALIDGSKELELLEIDMVSFFEQESERVRNFDLNERARFREKLSGCGYEEACREVGLEDRPSSLRKNVLALRRRISRK
ncbi:MAG: Coenzyme F420 hydrogenase/dehydrogenase, beta subunit C-terminal domain [Clostridia bacterium]|nr:Coenzyme F420 hydrogenase/dehydrogenase, beta subunit C-terminal domain [Clostridia bacterium]